MENEKIGLKDALKNNGNFMAFLEQEARSDEYRGIAEKAKKRTHPPAKILQDYAMGRLDRKKAAKVRKHISFCGVCAKEALKIMGKSEHPTRERLYDYVLDWLDKDVAEKVRKHVSSCKACADEVMKITMLENDLTRDTLNWVNEPAFELNIPNRIILWVSELWEPQWAGQLVTASDIPEQEHSFVMDDGKIDYGRIELSCYWEPEYEDTPSFLQLSWRANVTMPCELRAKFMNPETEEVLSEIGLGRYPEGKETFTSDQLEFDPSTERWAISIILCKGEK